MKVAVLGNGQLGAMMQQAGLRIGVEVQLLDVVADKLPTEDVCVTVEREHWPQNPFTQQLQQHPGWQNTQALVLLPNRIQQKRLLDELGLPTAPWCVAKAGMSQAELHQQLGPDVFLKSATGGYDGRGQLRLKADSPTDFSRWADNAIAERAIPFNTEVSIIGARGRDGQAVFYRLTENRHDDGVLTISLNCAGRFSQLQQNAEDMLQRLMERLDYVGVMAMECFLVGDQLLINEIAPRVHNSGHWTQAGASISQFELHLRALCGLPLPQPEHIGNTIMINLVGLAYDVKWLQPAGSQLHWYGKQLQPGRKMGHINCVHTDITRLTQWLEALELPSAYQGALHWAQARLAQNSSGEHN